MSFTVCQGQGLRAAAPDPPALQTKAVAGAKGFEAGVLLRSHEVIE